MSKELIMFITGIVGTVGFSILFGVRPKHLFFATVGGVIACGCSILSASLGAFAASAIAAFAATLYAELVSRARKAPVVTFLTPSLIVLVPGGSLYYTVANIISKNYSAANEYGLTTLDTCLGIAAGILAASLCVTAVLTVVKRSKDKKASKTN